MIDETLGIVCYITLYGCQEPLGTNSILVSITPLHQQQTKLYHILWLRVCHKSFISLNVNSKEIKCINSMDKFPDLST